MCWQARRARSDVAVGCRACETATFLTFSATGHSWRRQVERSRCGRRPSFGVIIVIVCRAGMIAPPVGLNVFVISGMVKDVPIDPGLPHLKCKAQPD